MLPSTPAVVVCTCRGRTNPTFAVRSSGLRYVKHHKIQKEEKTGKQAAKDTSVNSTGVGISVGLWIAAVNAISGTFLALGGTVIVPIMGGFGSSSGIIICYCETQ